MNTGGEMTAAGTPVGAQVGTAAAAREARAVRRLRLVQEWSEDEVLRPARKASRLTVQDWQDLCTTISDPVSAAMVVAARTSDPETAALPDFPHVEQQALDTLLAGDPGTLSRAHRTMVVTAAMKFAMVDGEEVEPATDPLDDLRGSVSKHILDWVAANATL